MSFEADLEPYFDLENWAAVFEETVCINKFFMDKQMHFN